MVRKGPKGWRQLQKSDRYIFENWKLATINSTIVELNKPTNNMNNDNTAFHPLHHQQQQQMPRTPLSTTKQLVPASPSRMPLQPLHNNVLQQQQQHPPSQSLQKPLPTTTQQHHNQLQQLPPPTPLQNNTQPTTTTMTTTTTATTLSLTPSSTSNNNKRKRQQPFSVYTEKKRLVDSVSETTGQLETTVVNVVNDDVMSHTIDDIVSSMRAQKKHYKQSVEKLKMELQLSNNEVCRLQESLREAEEIADQWQKKFREQQSSLQDKFAMFKTLRDQANELEQEVKTLKTTNAELTEKLQKQQQASQQQQAQAQASNVDSLVNRRKSTVASTTMMTSKSRQSVAPSTATTAINLELEKLREDYDNIKISHDLLRDERRTMEEQLEKYKNSLETLQSQSQALTQERDSLKKMLSSLQAEHSNTSMMLLDSNTKLSLAETKSLEMQKQLKDTRLQYQMEIEAMETRDNKDQIAERYREVLILNAEYQRQIDAIQQIVSNDLKPVLMTTSSVKNQVYQYQEHVSNLSITYQAALRKARDALNEYKSLCTEAEEFASEVTTENNRLHEELEESNVREIDLAHENMNLSHTVAEQQQEIDALYQTIYILQHQLEVQSNELSRVNEEAELQTAQVEDMMFDEIPELENHIVQFDLYYQSSKESIAYLEHRIQNLLGALSESDKRYNELIEFTRVEKQVLDESIKHEKTQTANIQFKYDQLEAKYTQLTLRREELEKQNMTLHNEVEAKSTTIESLSQQASVLKSEIESLKSLHNEMQSQIEEKSTTIESLKRQVSVLESETESLKSSCATLRQCISDAEANEKALRAQFNDEISTAHNHIQTLEQTLTKLTKDYGVAQSELKDAIDEIERLTGLYYDLEVELRGRLNNEKLMIDKFHREMSQFCEEKQKVEIKLRESRFECTTLKNDNKQLTLQLELILSKTQKKDWTKNGELSTITSIELAKKEIDQLHIQVANLTKQVSNLGELNKLLGKELSESRFSFANREKVMQENLKRAELEIRCLESTIEQMEQTLLAHASEISDIPALSKLISGLDKTKPQDEVQADVEMEQQE